MKKRDPGLRFKRRPIFVLVRNLVPVPLSAEAGKVLLFHEPRYADEEGIFPRAAAARQLLGLQFQGESWPSSPDIATRSLARAS